MELEEEKDDDKHTHKIHTCEKELKDWGKMDRE